MTTAEEIPREEEQVKKEEIKEAEAFSFHHLAEVCPELAPESDTISLLPNMRVPWTRHFTLTSISFVMWSVE